MELSEPVKKILSYYESDNPGTKANLARILLQGKLGGTGRLLILPFEHGPARSFAPNPSAYDPHYHYRLAIDAGLSVFAAPPASPADPDDPEAQQRQQHVTLQGERDPRGHGQCQGRATARLLGDRLYDLPRLGRGLRSEARHRRDGLRSEVLWSGGRDLVLSARRQPVARRRDGDRHQRLCCADRRQFGTHIIKVKPPTAHLELVAAKKVYEDRDIDISAPAARIRHVVQSAFNGRRIVVFSGGEPKDLNGVFAEVRAVPDGGGNGSIIGHNTFQRSKKDALDMLGKIIKIYQGED